MPIRYCHHAHAHTCNSVISVYVCMCLRSQCSFYAANRQLQFFVIIKIVRNVIEIDFVANN